jgi:hypothetical protein
MPSGFHNKNLLAYFLYILLSFVIVYPLAYPGAWPANHESQAFLIRTALYLAHFKSGEIPIWSSLDNFGFGSPQPILYHKLFYYFSGIGYALSEPDIKPVIIFMIGFWLFVGACGAYRICREAGCDNRLSFFAGMMLVSANYTTTNWLVRGAVAEFSAAMLVPWALAEFIQSLRQNKFRLQLSTSIIFLFLAHSVLAFYLALIFAIVTIIFLSSKRIGVNFILSAHSFCSLTLIILACGPILFLMFRMGDGYDMSRILSLPYLPNYQLKPLLSYFYDDWRWDGRTTWEIYTVAIDTPIIALTIIALGMFIFLRKRLPVKFFDSASITVLTLSMAISLFFQTKYAGFFYTAFPMANYIQFPWRLMAVITPTCIFLPVIVIGKIQSVGHFRNGCFFVVSCFALWMFAYNGSFSPIVHSHFPTKDFRYYSSIQELSFSVFQEYVPTSFNGDLRNLYSNVLNSMGNEECTVKTKEPRTESVSRKYIVSCRNKNTVVLPEFSSRFHKLKINHSSDKKCEARHDFPALCAITVNMGENEIEVFYPHLGSIFDLNEE